jgi:hypothetical protein
MFQREVEIRSSVENKPQVMFKEFEVLLAPRRVGKQQGYDNGNTKNYSARLFLPHEHQGRHNQLLINFLLIYFFHLFFFYVSE